MNGLGSFADTMHRIFPVLAAIPALVVSLAGAAGVRAQELQPQDWENKTVTRVEVSPLRRQSKSAVLNAVPLKPGSTATAEKWDRSHKELWKTGKYDHVRIRFERDPANPQTHVIAFIDLTEYELVESVEFRGLKAIPLNQVKPSLRIGPNDMLNAFHLKQDREYIRDQYLQKGYHFSSVQEEIRAGTTGVILAWVITEGPMVSVEEIRFTGNDGVSPGDLKRFMLTKENGYLLFIRTGREPFIERNLREDIERIKLYYRLEGWLDISYGERVFVQDLVYSEDRTEVTVTIHVDEGPRYRIRNILVQHDAADRLPRLFPDDEIKGWLLSRPGEFYTENNANKDISRVREKYGERAFINADINSSTRVSLEGRELDLVFTLRENEKQFVGKITFEGNTKTREDVLRREFTRVGFLPGEEFNMRNLVRAQNRIRERGYTDIQSPQGGIGHRLQEGDAPNSRDVVVDVKEGQTGNVRFAAGYSSAFGIIGILEFTQRNFDLGDLPSSLDDLFGGTGFAGGGQTFQIRLAPAAQRQSYMASFREPYVFGYDFGTSVRGYAISTVRESYDDDRIGGSVSLDRRFDPFLLQLTFNGYQIEVDDLEPDAPLAIQELEGLNHVYSLTPAIIFDTVDRDPFLVAYDGVHASLSYEYAGQVLPGDFDFDKLTFRFETYFKLYETEAKLKHVLNPQLTAGFMHERRRLDDTPLFERFYAGGRDSIRGFDFRGMGPHEGDDPIGGEAYVFGGVEYSFPIFVEFLRGAFFWDIANLTLHPDELAHEKWRNTIGFGFRFLIPQLGNVPITLDFGFPLTKQDDDERETVTFDIGRLF